MDEQIRNKEFQKLSTTIDRIGDRLDNLMARVEFLEKYIKDEPCVLMIYTKDGKKKYQCERARSGAWVSWCR